MNCWLVASVWNERCWECGSETQALHNNELWDTAILHLTPSCILIVSRLQSPAATAPSPLVSQLFVVMLTPSRWWMQVEGQVGPFECRILTDTTQLIQILNFRSFICGSNNDTVIFRWLQVDRWTFSTSGRQTRVTEKLNGLRGKGSHSC